MVTKTRPVTFLFYSSFFSLYFWYSEEPGSWTGVWLTVKHQSLNHEKEKKLSSWEFYDCFSKEERKGEKIKLKKNLKARDKNVLLLRKEERWERWQKNEEEAKTWTYRNILRWWEASSPLCVLRLLLMPLRARLLTQDHRGTTILRNHRPIFLTSISKACIFLFQTSLQSK